MLVMTRKVGESFVINNDIKIIALRARGTQARIGINAPRALPIFREEIYVRIMEDKSNGIDNPFVRHAGEQNGILVLTRGLGESIKIGSDITITTLNVFGNKMKIGIDAPRRMVIRREEIMR